MNLHECVTVLGITAELHCNVRAAAHRVLKMADSEAKPYVRLFLVSKDPAEVVRVALMEFESCKPPEHIITAAVQTTMGEFSALHAIARNAINQTFG